MDIKGSGSNFLRVYDEFITKLGLSWSRPGELATYSLIFSFNVRGQQAHFSFRYLEERLGMSHASALNSINSLVSKGLICKYQSEDLNGLDSKNSYVVAVEALKSAKAFDLVELMADPSLGMPHKGTQGNDRKAMATTGSSPSQGVAGEKPSSLVKSSNSEKIYRHMNPKDAPYKKYLFWYANDDTKALHLDMAGIKADPKAFASYARWNYLNSDRRHNRNIIAQDTDERNRLLVEIDDLNDKMESAKNNTQLLLKLVAQREGDRIRVKELETAIAGAKDKIGLDENTAQREGIDLYA